MVARILVIPSKEGPFFRHPREGGCRETRKDVMPAQAGIQKAAQKQLVLDLRFRGGDGKEGFRDTLEGGGPEANVYTRVCGFPLSRGNDVFSYFVTPSFAGMTLWKEPPRIAALDCPGLSPACNVWPASVCMTMETPNKSPISALFFDLDGTLLTSRKKLAPTSLSALRACAGKGIGIFVATARPPSIARQLSLPADQAELLVDGVFLNGAFIRHERAEEIRCLPQAAVRMILDIAGEESDVNIALQLSDMRHAFRYPLPGEEFRLWGLRGLGPEDLANFPLPADPAPSDVLKIVIFGAGEWRPGGKLLSALFAELAPAIEERCVVYLSDDDSVIQIMDKSASKKTGIERIMNRLGLSTEEIAVFGDDVNDMEMLAAFPNSIAMGNAPPDILALARYRTAGNDDDGIVYALRHILNLV